MLVIVKRKGGQKNEKNMAAKKEEKAESARIYEKNAYQGWS